MTVDLNQSLAESIEKLDLDAQRDRYEDQGRMVVIDDFLSQDILERLLQGMESVRGEVHRNYVPGQKKGAAVSRMSLDANAIDFGQVYRSPALRKFLESITGEELLDCLESDAHTYALYLYEEPGDHIGWHYDTSFYKGKRFTLLLGLVENESCAFECVLHTRSSEREDLSQSYKLKPGSLVLFDGDQLRHRVTPMAEGDGSRVVLTMEYVTDRSMNPWRKMISDVKDAFAYFGIRDVFFGRKSA